ncbi:uncharacterized protein [Coffea arabica]|uniref:Uncharacterized protein isoform X1 n=1 Tax=Coffea arabica TaxID=13443 RepID=A0A6P6X5M8_COFAR|nr:uncharacterized protein LOC113739822 isoform X1 [Coffea arabica]
MATSAFKSTTKRLSVGGGSSSGASADDSFSSGNNDSAKAHRRSRSLSHFSRRLPLELEEESSGTAAADYRGAPRGKFVNTTRGSEALEISLDDLALEFFSSNSTNGDEATESGERGRSRSARRGQEIGRWASDTASSRRRGRSVSRHRDGVEHKKVVSGGNESKIGTSEANSRRRRSLSVARHRISDSEVVSNCTGSKIGTSEPNSRRRRSLSVVRHRVSDSESDAFRNSQSHYNAKSINSWNSQVQKTSASADRRLQKSASQKDLAHLHDGYSSHSSALTDEETKDARCGKNGAERTIRTAYAQKAQHPNEGVINSGLYEVMCKELRYAVEEIRTELEHARVKNDEGVPSDSNGLQVLETYATKLEQSQKRKQDLLAEMLLEEQHGRELSKIVKELLPDSKCLSDGIKPARARKRSTDRNKMSKRLTEEAERYFEDFISNVEDTDISSFDGERSDGSSTLGGMTKPRDSIIRNTEGFQSPVGCDPHPVEMEGIILPWLQWETSNDGSVLDKVRKHTPITPKTLQWDAEQAISVKRDLSDYSISSHGSSSPGFINVHSVNSSVDDREKSRDSGIRLMSSFDMSEYLLLRRNDELLYERYKERNRINSGGLLLCTNVL